MNTQTNKGYYQQLVETIDHLQAQGHEVKITRLPSNTKYRRSSWSR